MTNSIKDELTEILHRVAEKGRMSAYSPGYTKLHEKPVDTSAAQTKLEALIQRTEKAYGGCHNCNLCPEHKSVVG